MDITPWHPHKPHIRFNDTASHYLLAGFMLGLSEQLDIPLRWGGAWAGWPLPHTSDGTLFKDLVHFELI